MFKFDLFGVFLLDIPECEVLNLCYNKDNSLPLAILNTILKYNLKYGK